MEFNFDNKEIAEIKRAARYMKNWKYYRIIFLCVNVLFLLVGFISTSYNINNKLILFITSFIFSFGAASIGYLIIIWEKGPIKHRILSKLNKLMEDE